MSNTTKTVRETIYSIMRDWGGIFGFTRMMTVLVIGRMQGFSLLNSLIKKLYSANGEEDRDEEGET